MISVLLPTFNSGLYIKEAVDSILNQTYSNFELLILDDGSTDNTHDIISTYTDKRILYFTEETNKGIVFQLNKGIELAKGTYIARMDADDRCFPTRFERQLSFFLESGNERIDVLGTNAISIGRNSEIIQFKNYLPRQISFLLNFYCPILHPTVMIKSKVFNQGVRYPLGYLYAEDFALWKIIDKGDNLAILNEILLEYRIHDNQTNSNYERLRIQSESSRKILGISKTVKLWSLLDNFFLKSECNSKIILDTWFGLNHSKKLNILTRIYISFRKKNLNIKLELLNKLSY